MMGATWLMCSLVLLLLPNKLQSQSDLIQFNFTSFNSDEAYADLILQGDAHRTGMVDRIRLTDDFVYPADSVGRVLYSPAIRLWDGAGRRQATFQTEFRSLIGEQGQGVAFFIAPVNATLAAASTGGNLGLYDASSGFSPVPVVAAEFDVFHNTWDPNYRIHLGININTRTSIAVEKWGEEPDSGSWRMVDIRITYDSRERLMTLVVTNPSRPFSGTRVEHAIDLKTYLPECVQIGISASTGNGATLFSSRHDVLSWSFISFMLQDDDTTDADTLIRQYTV